MVQPFANTLVNMTLTGAQIKTALEQQWQPTGCRPAAVPAAGHFRGLHLHLRPGRRGAVRGSPAMYLDGEQIDAADTFSVTVNSFLATGGDNFGAFAGGTGKRDTGKVDLQAMVDYLGENSPAAPDYTQRSVGVTWAAGSPAEYVAGDTVAFNLSSLAFTTAADTKDAQVSVKLGDTELGTFAVDNTIGTDVFDENGKASVSFALPAGLPAGEQVLTVTGVTTGTDGAAADHGLRPGSGCLDHHAERVGQGADLRHQDSGHLHCEGGAGQRNRRCRHGDVHLRSDGARFVPGVGGR